MKSKIDRYALEILMIISLIGIVFMVATRPETKTSYLHHTVQTGECVWYIAEKYSEQQIKPLNEFSWMISKENGLEGKFVRPGDVLIIPLVTSIERTR